MFLIKSTMVTLSAAVAFLSVSTVPVAAVPVMDAQSDTNLVCHKRVDDWDKNAMVSIQYETGEPRLLVDQEYYGEAKCSSFESFTDIPHECIYHNVCKTSFIPINLLCINYEKGFFKKSVYTFEELNSNRVCAANMICLPRKGRGDTVKPPPKYVAPNCTQANKTLESLPKKCSIKYEYFVRGMMDVHAFHYGEDAGKSCDSYEDTYKSLPVECIYEYVQKLEIQNPPRPVNLQEAEFEKTSECNSLNSSKQYVMCAYKYLSKLDKKERPYADEYEVDFPCEALFPIFESSKERCVREMVDAADKEHPPPKQAE